MKTYTPKPVRLPDTTAFTDEGNPYSVEQWQRFEPRPVPPTDWRAVGLRAVVALVLLLTSASVIWSTHTIGLVLHGGFGYGAAVVFDLSWATCLLVEPLVLHDDENLALVRRVGWALLAATMGVLFWRGAQTGDWALAVGGALVSAVAKVLWVVVMRCFEPKLSEQDRVDVAADLSKAARAKRKADLDAQTARAQAYADARRASVLPDTPVVTAEQVPALVPNQVPPAIDWSDVETAPAQVGPGSEPVPALVPVAQHFGTDVTGRTELLRNLIGTGTTEVPELRSLVQDAGFAAPSSEYIRRLIRTTTTKEI
ncbi:hypothetical protein [Streptacidiphilus sp. PAMC 29251]